MFISPENMQINLENITFVNKKKHLFVICEWYDTKNFNWKNLNQGLKRAGVVVCLLRNQRLRTNTIIILHTALLVS